MPFDRDFSETPTPPGDRRARSAPWTTFRGGPRCSAGRPRSPPGSAPGHGCAGPGSGDCFPDIYAPASEKDADLTLRSLGAGLLVAGRGVVSGYSAAELLDAPCAPKAAPAEVTASGRQRAHPGLLVHRDRLAPDEIQHACGLWVTSPLRTAFDLARRLDLVEGVVAVDALANGHRFHPDLILHLSAARRSGWTWPGPN